MATATVEKVCPRCGKTQHLAAPEGGMARRMAEGLAVICGECAARERAAEEAAEREKDKRAFMDRVSQSELPLVYRGLRWDDMDARSEDRQGAVADAKAWAEQRAEKPGLYIFGPVGTGKTRLASIATRRLMWDRPVDWISVPNLIARATAAFGSEDRKKAMAILTRGKAVALDDIDKLKASDHVMAQLFAAVDNRVSAKTPLLVTANLPVGKLGDRFGANFGDAIASRLIEHCTLIHMGGPDRRG